MFRSVCIASAALLWLGTAAAAQGAPPTWRLEQELVIGSRDGRENSLTRVTDVVVDAEGTMYVAQPMEQLVRAFSSTGQFARRMGRRGRGPGEFTQPSHLNWHGDTLIIADARGQRVAGFSRSGEHLFTHAFASLEQFMPRALLQTGKILGNRMVFQEDVAAGTESHEELFLHSGSSSRMRGSPSSGTLPRPRTRVPGARPRW